MTKLEVHIDNCVEPDANCQVVSAYRIGMREGARWALEQMTSEAAVKRAQSLFETEWDVNQEYARQMATDALAAVRKEIES